MALPRKVNNSTKVHCNYVVSVSGWLILKALNIFNTVMWLRSDAYFLNGLGHFSFKL